MARTERSPERQNATNAGNANVDSTQISAANDIPPLTAPSYRDRRTGLLLFGILEILLGALCLLMTGLMVLGQIMLARSTAAPVSLQVLIPGVLFYVGLSVAFVWLGVGSIQCRRWARALLLLRRGRTTEKKQNKEE